MSTALVGPLSARPPASTTDHSPAPLVTEPQAATYLYLPAGSSHTSVHRPVEDS